MEVRQLQIFRTLAEELNFTRTAEKVHTVQSNVTAQIKALEEELGIPLFDRLGRRVTSLTRAAISCPSRRRPSPPWTRVSAPSRPAPSPAGRCASALLKAYSPIVCPRYCTPSAGTFPTSNSSSVPYMSTPFALELEAGKLDMAITMSDSTPSANIKSVRLRTEQVFLLADPSHPLASKPSVKPSDLAGQNLLLTESGCAYREKLDRILALANIRPGQHNRVFQR